MTLEMSAMKRPYNILVVDDEPDLEPLIKQRMRRRIRRGTHSFDFANDGIEALEKLDANPEIDMVITDINMPRMDGLTLLDQIPNVTDIDVRCIVVSAYGDMQNIRTAMNRGAFDFVTKPIDFEDLQITMERALHHLEEWRSALSSRDALVALQNELEVASSTQQSILPKTFPKSDEYQVFANMEPARNVGGDFYDVIRLESGKVGLAIADVSDKGVPAALFMMSSRTLLKGAAIGLGDPGDALHEVNELLYEENETMMFVTVLYSIFDPASGMFTYSNGGHDAPVLVRAGGGAELLSLTGGVALGVAPDINFPSQTIQLDPGDTIVLYTDGVTEAMNGDGDQFGVDRIQEVFETNPPTDSEQATHALFEAVREFVGDTPQSDDITCLVLRRAEDGA